MYISLINTLNFIVLQITMTVTGDPLFSNLSAEDSTYTEPTEIESLCINCGENGVTKLLLTKIPHYKEIILMSFHCEYCGFSNNEIQSGGVIQETGLKVKVTIASERDLCRQVVRSDFATVTVPELELEIPPKGQKVRRYYTLVSLVW